MSKHSIHCAGYRGAGIPFDERQCDCQDELPDDIYLQGLADVLMNIPATYGTDQYDVERLTEIANKLTKMVPVQSGPEVNQPAKFVQVSGFGCDNSPLTQCSYMLVALDENGVAWLKPGHPYAKWEEQ